MTFPEQHHHNPDRIEDCSFGDSRRLVDQPGLTLHTVGRQRHKARRRRSSRAHALGE